VFVLDEFFVGEEILNLGDWRKMVFPDNNGWKSIKSLVLSTGDRLKNMTRVFETGFLLICKLLL